MQKSGIFIPTVTTHQPTTTANEKPIQDFFTKPKMFSFIWIIYYLKIHSQRLRCVNIMTKIIKIQIYNSRSLMRSATFPFESTRWNRQMITVHALFYGRVTNEDAFGPIVSAQQWKHNRFLSPSPFLSHLPMNRSTFLPIGSSVPLTHRLS